MKTNMNTNIKNWYRQEFPTDDLGMELNPNSTFQTLYDDLLNHRDVYENSIEGSDSLIRERCFGELTEILECDYDYVYQLWMSKAYI